RSRRTRRRGRVAHRTGPPARRVVRLGRDRIGDLLLGATLWTLGASLPWVLSAVTLVMLLEYLRARAQAVGMPGVGCVTVAERPTRLIVVGLAAGGAAAFPAGVPPLGWSWAGMFTIVWTALGVVGLAQLLRGVRRSMPASFPPDQ
ncbi:CDP-alcohol phosphatidyltransferase family protein, partial [Mycobacterium rufum]|nr:CDP-alcohol phosphatidyltransferase family protein [Mycolicibacterium rufum]